MGDEGIGVAATAATKFLLCTLIRVIVRAFFHDEINRGTDRKILGEILYKGK